MRNRDEARENIVSALWIVICQRLLLGYNFNSENQVAFNPRVVSKR